ncbi:unnamed protein product [Amoebophrya sp. A120]|nr:unnamed protein product [Amoebophrya sp. A120]|eukprot:GSA120T00023766001.1
MMMMMDTCKDTPNCYNQNGKKIKDCPFDYATTLKQIPNSGKTLVSGWATPMKCGSTYTNCACKYNGEELASSVYTNFPTSQPGQYKDLASIKVYGTSCNAWDNTAGTPWFAGSCQGKSSYPLDANPWCFDPWCYVDDTCPWGVASSVFAGTGSPAAKYSYQTCGFKDCYANSTLTDGFGTCPNDPTGTQSNRMDKKNAGTSTGDCECKYIGGELPSALYTGSAYANMTSIKVYGTSCAAWDSVSGTPWKQYCPADGKTDFCTAGNNYCQIPWCYVDPVKCSTGISTTVFASSGTAMAYSYDTCRSAPDCYTTAGKTANAAKCPYDSKENEFYTPHVCKLKGTFSDCSCKAQGTNHTTAFLDMYPITNPGQYKNLGAVGIYGSSCAAWDRVPDTPWVSYCQTPANFGTTDNWCTSPWCYADESCTWGVQSSVFQGSPLAFYSYQSCGVNNCYTSVPGISSTTATGFCPNDPTGTKSNKYDKAGSCACLFGGDKINSTITGSYPASNPGQYQNLKFISYYGTTCAAWDQMPDTPWYSYCPASQNDVAAHLGWCSKDYNWCQVPWCYVDPSCPTGIASSVFAGSTAAKYSYDTCRSAPDCYNTPYDTQCPADASKLNNWHTAKACGTTTWAAYLMKGYDRATSLASYTRHSTPVTMSFAMDVASLTAAQKTAAKNKITSTLLSIMCGPVSGTGKTFSDLASCTGGQVQNGIYAEMDVAFTGALAARRELRKQLRRQLTTSSAGASGSFNLYADANSATNLATAQGQMTAAGTAGTFASATMQTTLQTALSNDAALSGVTFTATVDPVTVPTTTATGAAPVAGSTTATTSSSSSDDDMDTGVLIAIILGGIAGLALIVVIVLKVMGAGPFAGGGGAAAAKKPVTRAEGEAAPAAAAAAPAAAAAAAPPQLAAATEAAASADNQV